jgi:type I restriction enzyme, S subunit
LKAGWSEAALGEVATIYRRAVKPTDIADDTLYVGLENIERGGAFRNVGTVSNGELASTKFAFDASHILYGKLRPNLGKIARPTFGGVCSTDILPITSGSSIDRDYLAHFFARPEIVQLAADRATGAHLPRISPKELERFRIIFPPLHEQRKIVRVLDRVDALRAKRRATLKAHDLLSQAQFLSRFGDPFSNPMRWPLVPLGDLFSEKPVYGTMIPGDPEHGQWLCLRVANINGWNLDLSNRKFVDLPISERNRHEVRDGDLLLARAIASEALLGKAVIAEPGMRRWAFDSHLMRLRFDLAKADPQFIRELLRSRGGRTRFMRVTRRSAVQFNVNTKEIAALEVPCPEIALQLEFGVWQGRVNDLQRRAEVHLDHLATLFSVLQRRAFNGEL